MLSHKRQFSLLDYNTFGLDVSAREVFFLDHPDQWKDITDRHNALILGGGSNVLLLNDLDRAVVINRHLGIRTEDMAGGKVRVHAASGENWHELVVHAVSQGFGGIENLSLIPGSVGAAPMQNIGAYGVEIKDVLVHVKALDLDTLEEQVFDNGACQFGYRESVFKRALKGQYFITEICLELTTDNHLLNTSYGAIEDQLKASGIDQPGIADISEAVIQIRRSKLPDPEQLGNAGSFFKNPVIDPAHYQRLQAEFEDLKYYLLPDGNYKIPAGWMIEKLGWKGKRVGRTGSHTKQALVLVNYGGATGQEIGDLSRAIQEDVMNTFGIRLETEVNFIQ